MEKVTAVILAGGVIEELLRLYLEYKGFKPIKMILMDIFRPARKKGF